MLADVGALIHNVCSHQCHLNNVMVEGLWQCTLHLQHACMTTDILTAALCAMLEKGHLC